MIILNIFFIKVNKKLENEFNNKTVKPTQLKIIKYFRNWMKFYWYEDFLNNKEIYNQIELWIKDMKIESKLNFWNGLIADTV